MVRGWAPLVSSGKRLLSYGTPRMLADLVFQLTSFVPLLVVFSKFGETATGLFSTAITLQLMIIPLFSFSGQILLQRVSEMIARADFTKIRRIIRLFMFIFTSVAAVGVVTIGVGIDFWLSLLFSKKFLPAASLVIIVAPSLIPRAIYLLLRNPLDAVSNIPYNLFSLLIWFAIYIVSLFVADSIEACAWGYTLSSVTLAVTSLLFWHKALNKTIEKQKERLQD
ncbi:lipopolysaccharide biosynthesis protein [Porphyromonas endodontalis]|uniref:lipopolysaccharide biosynthesis protein n=1 Tax=Porphyromonas endodontalis TaxID=28124 RepID=UPI003C7CE877